MNIPGPLIIGAFTALFIFYYFDQKNRIRRRQRRADARERKKEQLDALINNLRKKQKEK